ncbi:uncharacterized protein LOC113361387 [Papaver somniferum]|uniref:uncharacterized protein LOC113361387 n=1 Tax=Papaver somniferum TaxID=3469 RepID=UPI000E704B49|nr:uncharacterized protein LOC113361387 [Papaver somniferum]
MQAVKEKLSDIAAMRKAKAEAKAEEQEEKDLAKARIEVAKEMRKAKEAEAQVEHHLEKAGQKAEKELAKPHPYHQNLDNPSPNPVPNTMDGHQMHHTDRGSGAPPMEGLAEPRLTREFPPATNQHI